VIATAVLWLLLRELQRTAPRQAIPAALMCVAAALVAADLVREDAGFVATVSMGALEIVTAGSELDVGAGARGICLTGPASS
jgi:hypothetical protein